MPEEPNSIKKEWTPSLIACEIASKLQLEVHSFYRSIYSVGYWSKSKPGYRQWNAVYSFEDNFAKDIIDDGMSERFTEAIVRRIQEKKAMSVNKAKDVETANGLLGD